MPEDKWVREIDVRGLRVDPVTAADIAVASGTETTSILLLESADFILLEGGDLLLLELNTG